VISGEITKSVGRMLATWTHRPTLLERIGQAFERDSKVTNWSGWTEDDAARTIQTEIHFLTEGVPASCPPEKWTELDVEDVPTWNGSERRCWNKPLAKKLAEKARAAREQRQAKAAAARDSDGKNPSKGKKAAAAKSLTEYQLKDAWEAWFARRLRERLTGKLSKAERELAAKFAFAMEPEPFWTLQKHFGANGKRISTADALNRIAATSWQDLHQILLTLFITNLADRFCNPIQDIEEAIAMATPFGITVDRFRPDAEFLAVMPEPWLEIFCSACSVERTKSAEETARRLIDAWTPGWIPQELAVAKKIGDDKPAKKAKAKR
jgi:hypothetical protein